jgi:hypothetical protein
MKKKIDKIIEKIDVTNITTLKKIANLTSSILKKEFKVEKSDREELLNYIKKEKNKIVEIVSSESISKIDLDLIEIRINSILLTIDSNGYITKKKINGCTVYTYKNKTVIYISNKENNDLIDELDNMEFASIIIEIEVDKNKENNKIYKKIEKFKFPEYYAKNNMKINSVRLTNYTTL